MRLSAQKLAVTPDYRFCLEILLAKALSSFADRLKPEGEPDYSPRSCRLPRQSRNWWRQTETGLRYSLESMHFLQRKQELPPRLPSVLNAFATGPTILLGWHSCRQLCYGKQSCYCFGFEGLIGDL